MESARTVRAVHPSPLGRTMGENSGMSWWKTTGEDGLTEVQDGFLGLLDVFTHIGSEPLCSRGRVGLRLRKLSDGQPLV